MTNLDQRLVQNSGLHVSSSRGPAATLVGRLCYSAHVTTGVAEALRRVSTNKLLVVMQSHVVNLSEFNHVFQGRGDA